MKLWHPGTAVDILYGSRELEALCTEERKAQRELGKSGFRKLRTRLSDLEAAGDVTDLLAGRPHPLEANRKGQFAVDLDAGRRLVFEPAVEPVPRKDDGGIAWGEVTAVRIVFIGDYHD